MIDKINALKSTIEGLTAASDAEVEALRVKYLSKKGEISLLFNDFRTVPAEQKKAIGQALNELKNFATERINSLRDALASADTGLEGVDLTRTPAPLRLGTRHPLSLVREEIIAIFRRLGFTVAEGPEIEDDWHVFESLNFAADHPARDMQDTFFIQRNPDVLLRTHTSSVQTRVMEKTQPPIRIICPGRVYRNEAISARAHCFFHQVEALYIDKNVSFADLRQTLLYFAREMFGPDTKIRLRPSYFPFTEPSAEWIYPATSAEARMLVLQGHGMGGDTRMRHGRPQRARSLRHRLQSILRIRSRHGHRAHHQPEIQGERPAHVLGKRCPFPRRIH